jgi:hypothetical protein
MSIKFPLSHVIWAYVMSKLIAIPPITIQIDEVDSHSAQSVAKTTHEGTMKTSTPQ